jgi:hypothetical protein
MMIEAMCIGVLCAGITATAAAFLSLWLQP